MNDNIKWIYTTLIFKDIYGLPAFMPIKEKLFFIKLFGVSGLEDMEKYNFAQSLIKE